MSKVRKSILIIGILLIVVAASLATALALLATGTIKTDPVELVYTVKDAEKEYDGTPLKATEFRLSSGTLNAGDVAEVEFVGEQTGVGTSKSDLAVKIYDKDGYNVTNNYSVKVESGELTVTKRSVSIDLPSQKAVYNGTTVALDNYKIAEDSQGELIAGHKIFGSTDGGLLNVGDTVDEDLFPLIFDAAGNNVTENYDIEFNVGEIEVVARPISIRPVSVSKVYDGSELVADKIEFVEGSLADGQYIRYIINDSLSNALFDAGVKETRVTGVRVYATVDGEEVDVTENYEIDTFETGVLEITPRPLTVTAKSGSWVYDGMEHSLKNDPDALSVEGLANGDEFREVTYGNSITNVGKTVNAINGVYLSCTNKNYDIKIVNGTLEITAYELEITTATAEKYYDGQALYAGAVKGETANINHSIGIVNGGEYPSIINAGSIPNAYECDVYDLEGNPVTGNYKITYKYGTLTVNKRPVTALLGKGEGVESDEKTEYNGREQKPDLTNPDYFRLTSVEDGNTAPLTLTGRDFEVVSLARYMLDAGEYTYSVKFADRSLADNYELYIPSNGYFTITPKALAIATEGATRDYNGEPLYNGNYTVGEGTGYVFGHEIALPDALPSITDAGEIVNDFAIAVRDENGADVTKNYAVTYKYGNLTVTPLSVTVRLSTGEITREYTGKVITIAPEDIIMQITSGNGLLTESDFTVTYESEVVNVKRGTNNAPTYYSCGVEISDAQYAKNFNLTVLGEGKLRVNPANVTVSVKDVNTLYDGQQHFLDAYTAIYSVSDPCKQLTRDDFAVTFNPENNYAQLLNAGKYMYSVIISDTETGNNYTVTVNNAAGGNANRNFPATYEIEKFTVNITVASKTFVYDGEEHTSKEFGSTALANSRHVLTAYPAESVYTSVKNVNDGRKKNNLSFAVFDSDAPDANNITDINYIINVEEGYLQVTAGSVTVKTPDGVSTYNGREYSNTDGVQVSGAEGFTAQYDEGGAASITNVGTQSNVFACRIFNGGGEDVTENFEIAYDYGTLQIVPLEITVRLNDVTDGLDGEMNYNDLVYSGERKTVNVSSAFGSVETEGEIESAYLPDAEKFEIVYGGGMVDAGVYGYTLRFTDSEYASNFSARFTDGTITIGKLAVTVTLNDERFTFDGGVKTLGSDYINSITDERGNAVGADLLPMSAFAFGEINGNVVKNAGTYSYRAYLSEQEYVKNFTVVCEAATIVIDALDVNVTLKQYGFTFDNTAKSVNAADAVLNIDTALLTCDDFGISLIGGGAVKNAGEYGYEVVITDRTYAQNFVVNCTDGNITVSKLSVNVSLENFTFTYDGNAHTVSAKDAVNLDTNLVTPSIFEIVTADKAENAGTYAYSVQPFVDLDGGYYGNFDFVFGADGSIEIKPLGVTVSLASYSKVFDGAMFTVGADEAVSADTSLINSNSFVLTGTDNIINAGEYTYGVELADGVNNFTLNNPSCTGRISVQKADVSVQLRNRTLTYGETYNFTQADLIGNISSVTLDATDFTVAYNDADTESAGNHYFTVTLNAPENYRLTVLNSGCITVKPREVTITTQDGVFTYDGNAHSKEDNVDLRNALSGHKAVIVNRVSLTNAGSVKNELLCKITDAANNNVTDNYVITYNYGTLTVNPRPVSVTLSPVEVTYNGENHAGNIGADVITVEDAAGTLEATDFNLTFSAPLVNAGSYTYSASLKNGNPANYVISVSDGTVTIGKATLSVSLADYAATYAGTAVSIEYTEGKFTEVVTLGENYDELGYAHFRLVTYGEMKNVGTYEYGIEFATASLYNNYDLVVTNGKLEIEKAKITVRLNDYSFVYSGKSVTLDAANAIADITSEDGKTLITKSQFSVVYKEGEIKLVKNGGYKYNVEITSAEIANNFDVTADDGTVEITKRKLTFTLADLVISEYSAPFGYNSEFDVTNLLSVSSGTPLAEGDSITINNATATGDSTDRTMTLDSFISGINFTLTNADCYDINVDGIKANVTIIYDEI